MCNSLIGLLLLNFCLFLQSFSWFPIINILFLSSFCSFLLYPECCSIANGRYVNEGLAELKLWCREATEKVILYFFLTFLMFSIFMLRATSYFMETKVFSFGSEKLWNIIKCEISSSIINCIFYNKLRKMRQ